MMFTTVIFTTVGTLRVVLKMASGSGRAEINWTWYFKSFGLICGSLSMGLGWPITNFIRFLKGCPFYNHPDNKEKAEMFSGYIFDWTWFELCLSIDGIFGQLELFIRTWLVKMLGCVLWEIAELMKTTKILKTIRKYKLKEWSIFIVMYMIVAGLMGFISLTIVQERFEWDNLFSNFFLPKILEQDDPKIKDDDKKSFHNI